MKSIVIQSASNGWIVTPYCSTWQKQAELGDQDYLVFNKMEDLQAQIAKLLMDTSPIPTEQKP